MPLGSSSDAPVISPGPRSRRSPRQVPCDLWWCRLLKSTCGSENAAQQVEKHLELVVMHPVPGAFDRHCPGVLEVPDAPVLLGVRRPAFLAVDQQGGAGDA